MYNDWNDDKCKRVLAELRRDVQRAENVIAQEKQFLELNRYRISRLEDRLSVKG